MTAVDERGQMGISVVGVKDPFYDHVDLIGYLSSKYFAKNQETLMKEENINRSISAISVRVSLTDSISLDILKPHFAKQGPQHCGVVMPPAQSVPVCFATAPHAENKEESVKRSVPKPSVTGKDPPKRQRKAPMRRATSAPPRSPTRVRDVTGTYDIMNIGGDPSEMRRVASICAKWDSETVIYVIEHGGRPPLVGVTGETRLELICTFQDPDGSAVFNVLVPRNTIALLYGNVTP